MLFGDCLDDVNHMFTSRTSRVLVDLPKMTDGRLDASIMVAYIPQGERTDEGNSQALALTKKKLGQIQALPDTYPHLVQLASTPDDIAWLKATRQCRAWRAECLRARGGWQDERIGHDGGYEPCGRVILL